MLERLRTVESELVPLRAAVSGARHPWGWILAAIIFGGGVATFFLFKQATSYGLVSGLLTLAGVIWSGRHLYRFGKILGTKRDALDAALIRDVLQVTEHQVDASALDIYQEAGFFGHWAKANTLRRFSAEGRELLLAHLTKTESYTDSDGNRKTRTVTVFRGLLFTLPAPFALGPAITTVSTGSRPRPHGRFAPASKPDRIKTASLDFNTHHKVYTTDSVLGHGILDPDRTMRFINMEHDLSDATRWGRSSYAMLFTDGRVHVAVSNVTLPVLANFPESDALEKALRSAHAPLTLPAVMAHHLRLPPNSETPP